MDFLSIALGAVVGAAVTMWVVSSRTRTRLLERAAEVARLEEACRQLEERADEREALLRSAQKHADRQLREAFEALSADALRKNNASFLQLAKSVLAEQQTTASAELSKRQMRFEELVKPVALSLDKVQNQVQEMEKVRHKAYGELSEQVRNLGETQQALHQETGNLVKALRAPSVRGRWGEMQLRRVVELAGMLERCDFTEQTTVQTADGRIRPDLIVHLPGGKQVVVDAKTPLASYLNAAEAEGDEERAAHLKDHARQVRDHVTKLAAKNYWAQFERAPEYVIMFLPGEVFLNAALQEDPALIEYSAQQRVMLTSPISLITLLRAVAYGWQQELVAENAREISELGRSLYQRLRTLIDHFGAMGRSLDRTVEHYNRAMGSLESRVLVAARRFEEMGATSEEELDHVSQLERTTRLLQVPDPDSLPKERPDLTLEPPEQSENAA